MITAFGDAAEDAVDAAGAGRIIRLTGANAESRADFALKAHQRLLARGRPSFILGEAMLRQD